MSPKLSLKEPVSSTGSQTKLSIKNLNRIFFQIIKSTTTHIMIENKQELQKCGNIKFKTSSEHYHV